MEPIQQTHRRDYFRFTAPMRDVTRIMARRNASPCARNVLVLDLQADTGPEVEIESRAVPVVPYPTAVGDLVALITEPSEDAKAEGGEISLLLPREPFDRVADEQGVERIDALSLAAGSAVGDTTVSNLGDCLTHAAHQATGSEVVVSQIRQALTVHLAQTYGGLHPPETRASGGLAPWQLCLARNTFDQHLDGSFSLKTLARECGLSCSYFARAFARSTGLPPHRWLQQRRIEAAKEMMRDPRLSLAEIALACGFADQSHFTRIFSKACAVTPGSWRRSRAVAAQL